jgi:hypothetical protein
MITLGISTFYREGGRTMRGIMLRALPVCVLAFTTGCFLLKGEQAPSSATPRTETHAYWKKVDEILARQPASPDVKSMIQLVSEQTDALRALSPEGVDPDLVAAVDDLIRCEEVVLDRWDQAGGDVENLKTIRTMAELFASANKKAADSKKRLWALRETLNSRHGGGFAQMAAEQQRSPRR